MDKGRLLAQYVRIYSMTQAQHFDARVVARVATAQGLKALADETEKEAGRLLKKLDETRGRIVGIDSAKVPPALSPQEQLARLAMQTEGMENEAVDIDIDKAVAAGMGDDKAMQVVERRLLTWQKGKTELEKIIAETEERVGG